MRFAGRSPLGVAYGVVASELLLGLCVPSCAARGAGILLPILVPVMTKCFDSDPGVGTQKRFGTYLILVAIHANAISSTMWYTGVAWNPTIRNIARRNHTNSQAIHEVGYDLNFAEWALSFSVPCLVNAILLPLVMWVISP